MISNVDVYDAMEAPVRRITARVERYNGSTLIATYTHEDRLQSFTVDRVGEGKFFGFGVCQKINIKLIDKMRNLNITTDDSFKVYINDVCPFPTFYVTEVHRDETNNTLSITAYDLLYKAANTVLGEISTEGYALTEILVEICAVLNVGFALRDDVISLELAEGANFDGTETVREALNACAEVMQQIYYVGYDDLITFRKLQVNEDGAYEIGNGEYFTLDSGDNRRLATIVHVTELGDNLSVTTGLTGSTQYIRDNPFLTLNTNITNVLDYAIENIGGLTINEFSCEWRGNVLLEIGDYIAFGLKDGSVAYSYFVNDTLTYDGSLSQKTEWYYDDNEEETAAHPTTLGDALKQTYAKVDKVNRQIDLVASETTTNSEAIAGLQITTEGVIASVQKVEQTYSENIDSLTDEVATLTSRVDAAITSEDVTLQIESALANGVNKVTTTTGFTFDEEGLTVSRSDSEMTTTITEDGMTVYRNNESVLVADHEGVKAEDLQATTYLIIGKNSRFEDYDSNRTGCFWIGG